MVETKTENKFEKEYTIPLRREWAKVPRYKRANKAVKAIKEFLARHMKIYDRDLGKIKIDKYINEEIWFRGIKNPPARIKVKATKEGEIVRVELFEMPEILKFKKAREEKREKIAEEGKPKKQENRPSTTDLEHEHKEEVGEKTEEKIAEEKEKKSAVVESMEKIEKETAKKMKHQTKQSKQPKHPVRQALKK